MPTKRKELPPGDFLRAHLRYDPETGLLYRRSTGAVASLSGHRYALVTLMDVLYVAHRVIWRMEISEEVPFEIDHFNGDKKDNRLSNLRPATHAQNNRNRGLTKANKSGFKGVSWYKANQKWRARIRIDLTVIHLGYFDDPAIAHEAYVKAAIEHHQEFANDGYGPI